MKHIIRSYQTYFYNLGTTVVFVISLCSFNNTLKAQHAPFNFLKFTVNEGLSQNSVWCQYRDSRGWFWAGTSGGVSCKQGSIVKVYKQALLDSSTVQGNNINFIFEDKYGHVWIGNDGGIDVFNPITAKFNKAYSFKFSSPSQQRVYYYLMEPDSNYVWLGINNKQVYRFDIKKQKPIEEISNKFPKPYAFEALIWSSVQNKNKAYLYFDNGQLLMWDFKQAKMQVSAINIKYGTALWLYNDTCYLYNAGYIAYLSDNKLVNVKKAPGLNVCRTMTYWNNLLVFAGEDGYILYDPVTRHHNYYASLDPALKKTYCRISSAYTDKQGILWFGTDGKGIFYHTPLQNRFKHINYKQEEYNMVKGMCLTDNETLLHIVYGRGLMRYNLTNGNFKLFESNFTFPNLKSKAFSAVCPSTKPKHAWVAHTLSNGTCGLYRVNIETGKGEDFSGLVTPVLGTQAPYSYNSYLDRFNGNTYIISNSSLIEINETKAIPTSKVVFYDTSLSLSCFKFSKDGKHVIIGYSGGALVSTVNSNTKPKTLHEVGKDLAKCIVQHTKGDYYIATTGGVFIYDKQFNFIEKLSTNNGLADNFIYGLLEDRYGIIWISHNKGLNRFDPTTHQIQHFEAKHGLQSNEFNTNAFAVSTNVTLFFGGVNGINYFDPKDFLSVNNPIHTFVNEVQVFDEPYTSDTTWSHKKQLQLPYYLNTLSFEFGNNDVMAPDDVNFLYKLEGIDRDWIKMDGRGFVRYPKLPSGNYNLLIKALDGIGNQSDETYSLQVNIDTPYWKTWWFKLLIIIASLILVGFILLLFIYRNKRKLEKEMMLQKRLEGERLRISRDLHDHVGAQLSYLITNLDWMLSHPDELNKEEETTRLKDLSETGKQAILTLRQTIWALHNTEISVIDFADKFKQFSRKMLAFSPHTKIVFEEEFSIKNVLTPELALSLFRICQEAIINAIKHAEATEIKVKFRCSTNCIFSFEISDNGKGFLVDQVITDGHYGLENMKARAQECGADFIIDSQPKIGTRLSIQIK